MFSQFMNSQIAATNPRLCQFMSLLLGASDDKCQLSASPSSLPPYRNEMTVEPVARQPRHFVQRPGFLEQVCGSRHDH
jgi:hypothetical protein